MPIMRKDRKDEKDEKDVGVFGIIMDQVDGIFATTIYRYVLGIIAAGGDKTRSRVGGVLV